MANTICCYPLFRPLLTLTFDLQHVLPVTHDMGNLSSNPEGCIMVLRFWFNSVVEVT